MERDNRVMAALTPAGPPREGEKPRERRALVVAPTANRAGHGLVQVFRHGMKIALGACASAADTTRVATLSPRRVWPSCRATMPAGDATLRCLMAR